MKISLLRKRRSRHASSRQPYRQSTLPSRRISSKWPCGIGSPKMPKIHCSACCSSAASRAGPCCEKKRPELGNGNLLNRIRLSSAFRLTYMSSHFLLSFDGKIETGRKKLLGRNGLMLFRPARFIYCILRVVCCRSRRCPKRRC